MTGLSSVAGVPLQAQVRAVFDAAGSLGSLDPSVVNAARMAAKMLRSAIERTEMQEANKQRAMPDPEVRSETGPEPRAGDGTQATGRNLDVTA
jgi:hypothetical protein